MSAVRTQGGEMLDVSLPSGVRLLHIDDLTPASPGPSKVLLDGRLGDPVAYGLRLRSLYLSLPTESIR